MIPSSAVYLVSGITDMRKSIDGLSLIVADVLEMDPLSSAWFIFCNCAFTFQEWRDVGIFERFWQNGLIYEGVDWRSISMDGCQTKAPLAGSKKRERTQQTEQNKA